LVDPNDAAIVTTIIAMASHLNLKVIAEGVETEEQKRYLLEHNCFEIQGYIYSPAISALDVELLWKSMEEAAAARED
jgi:EAL domain-containing protein (putative c-di-GMP-specific phosphodiesterase class I)